MIDENGHFALVLALCIAALQAVVPLVGAARNDAALISWARPAALAQILFVATAFFSLLGAVLGGYVGWKIGKRLYREYEPPVIKDRRSNPRATPEEAK